MNQAAKIHNAVVPRLLKEMVEACNRDPHKVAVMAESLVLGAAMFAFPTNPRAQAQFIQEIANAASERVKVAGQ